MIEVTVTRSQWYRGKGSRQSRLLLKSGKRCCIGFLGQALGLPDAAMLRKETLHTSTGKRADADEQVLRNAACFAVAHYPILDQAYAINDGRVIRESQRELELTELGKLMGVNFTFVD